MTIVRPPRRRVSRSSEARARPRPRPRRGGVRPGRVLARWRCWSPAAGPPPRVSAGGCGPLRTGGRRIHRFVAGAARSWRPAKQAECQIESTATQPQGRVFVEPCVGAAPFENGARFARPSVPCASLGRFRVQCCAGRGRRSWASMLRHCFCTMTAPPPLVLRQHSNRCIG